MARRRIVVLSVVAGLLAVAVAAGVRWRVGPPEPPQDPDRLTAENARLALVELVRRDDAFEGTIGRADLRRYFSVGRVRALAWAEVEQAGSLAHIGEFQCDLAARTFSRFAHAYRFSGHFEFRDGRWAAVIDESMHLNFGPPGGR
jgi:hypothetical protein